LAKLGRKTLVIDAAGAKPPVAYLTVSLTRPVSAERGYHRKPDVELHSGHVVTESLTPTLTPITSFMDQAFKDVTSEYDIVLIDASPILISAETEFLARLVDVTILVSEAGRTSTPQLVRCARLLERLQVQGMAAIINKVSLLRTDKATQEDVRLFETRMNKENLAWKPTWIGAPDPDESLEHQEQPAVARQHPSIA
jgi:Mrp family chromosome partitioning ATPase